ncbi:MAG: calcium-binding protein [Rhodobacterales bacterium]|nr:calcium-binding protein [Rhodobacterales bacterium]
MPSFALNTSSTTQQTLTTGQSGFVGVGVNLYLQAIPSGSTGDAIIGSGSTSITVMGVVGSSVGDVIDVAGGSSTIIDVGVNGQITSAQESAIEVDDSTKLSISNAGTISAKFQAIEFNTTDDSAQLALINTGTILSTNSVAISANTGAGLIEINNSGLVSSLASTVVDVQTTSFVLLSNTGTISRSSSSDSAIFISANDIRLYNSGEIIGRVIVTGTADIKNTGLINGIVGANGGGNVQNLGTIVGDLSTSNQIDTVTNTGMVDGDVLTGGGNDTIDLRGGTVTGSVAGGDGNDTYIVSSGSVLLVEDGLGTSGTADLVQSTVTFTLGANIETLELIGSDDINGAGNTGANTLLGNASDNRLSGRAGDDTLDGGDGNDILRGGAGNDRFITDGDDTLIESADSGTDTVQSAQSFTLGTNFENLTLSGAANASGTGNAAANTITGNAGNNTLNGLTGNDTLDGSAGADSFVFSTALGSTNIDSINNFSAADDTFRLDDAVFTGLAVGTLAGSAFASNTTGNAGDATDRIIYESDTGKVFFDTDGTGAAAKVQFATISTGLVLTSADFIVF